MLKNKNYGPTIT